MNEDARGTNAPGQALTRRTLVKGAAWSVPVIAAAVALPMAAASDVPVQTQCMDQSSVTFGITSSPVTPPYATIANPYDPAYPLHQFKEGQSYEITVTSTITYTGALPARIDELTFLMRGTRSLDWTFSGTPTVVSTRGNITLGTAVGQPDDVAPRRTGVTEITPAPVGSDAYVHPGDVITITWNLLAHGPKDPVGVTGSGYAYPYFLMTSCGASTPYYPSQTPTQYPLYMYVQ